MINNYIKNICLIVFALVGPISLPAGGIQRSIDTNLNIKPNKSQNSKEIIGIIKNEGIIISTKTFPILLIEGKLEGKNLSLIHI